MDKRYIVLGTIPDVTAWRVKHRVSPRDVCAVSTTQGHLTIRGVGRAGVEYHVVRLPSWGRATERVRDGVDAALGYLRAGPYTLIET